MPDDKPVEDTSAEITDELEKGGPAFGAFVSAVGTAVAASQDKLDATMVKTAKELANPENAIDVIAIWEQEINNEGEMIQGHPIIQKLPLVTYIMPTAYQWKKVVLQADMYITEFNAAHGFNIKGSYKSETTGGATGLVGLLGGRGGSTTSGEASLTTTGSVSVDVAAGRLHMDATLEPRPEIQPPKPYIVQKGPRMKVTAGAREDIPGATEGTVLGRKIKLTIELRDSKNEPLGDKKISIQISDPLINYTTTPADGKTDKTTGSTQGTLTIELKREGAAYDAAKPPEPVTVKTWLGLISEQVVVNL